MKTKVCKVCGKEFQSNGSRAWLCSDECRKIQGRLNNNVYADRKRATLPENEVVECKICGKHFSWLAKHLKHQHSMTMADYKKRIPVKPLYQNQPNKNCLITLREKRTLVGNMAAQGHMVGKVKVSYTRTNTSCSRIGKKEPRIHHTTRILPSQRIRP